MNKIINAIFSLLLISYPFIIYLLITKGFSLVYIALGLFILFVLRFIWLWRCDSDKNKIAPQLSKIALFSVIIGGIIALFTFGLNSQTALLFYPVMMNGLFLVVFLWSLYYPPNIIESFARITEKELSANIISYTRKVAWVWCAFFVINGSFSLYTILSGSIALWTLYNGLISYILMGLLFTIEYCVRYYVKKKFN